jgi:hypothetical protein
MAGFMVEDGGYLLLDNLHFPEDFCEPDIRDGICQAKSLKRPARVNEPCNVIQGTDWHAADVQALSADPAVLDQGHVFPRGCQPYRRDPACRASPENRDHAETPE